MNPHTKILTIVAILLLVGIVSAVPLTGAATSVGSNNASIACSGTISDWTVRWGMTSNVYWTSSAQPNSTAIYRIHESPLVGNTLFYYQCCDNSGCGLQNTFTTLPVTPLPTQTIGSVYQNMTESGYDFPSMAVHLIDPYIWGGIGAEKTPVTIVFMLIFSPIFIGVWLRSRSALVALLLGFITGGFILTVNANNQLGISMPAEIVGIAQAMVYIAFAGSVLYILHR